MNSSDRIKLSAELLAMKHKNKKREAGIDSIKNRIQQLEKEIEKGGAYYTLQSEIDGLNFALKALGEYP